MKDAMNYKLYLIASLYVTSCGLLIGAEQGQPLMQVVDESGNQGHPNDRQPARQRFSLCCRRPEGRPRCTNSQFFVGTIGIGTAVTVLTMVTLCVTEAISCPAANGTSYTGGGGF